MVSCACFVCLDDCSLAGKVFKVCNCNTFVHAQCFAKTVTNVPSHTFGCPICKHPFVCTLQRHPDFGTRLASLLCLSTLWLLLTCLIVGTSRCRTADVLFLAVCASGWSIAHTLVHCLRNRTVYAVCSAPVQQDRYFMTHRNLQLVQMQ